MPRKIKDVTKDYLVNVTLPVHGQSYTVISHQSIIDYAYQELANQGFGIVDEEYRSTLDGQIAQGIYRLQFGTDPEMNLMFAWTNSYNKQIRFKCATGGYVNANQTVMLAGELGTYARKHTGTADADVIASMQVQITNATMYYNQLVKDKEVMKTIPLTSRRQAELLGILFAEYEILTTEQASIIRQQMDKPSFFYNGGKDTLWAFYNHVTVALQQSHPRSWMEDQRMLHWVISNEFDLSTPVTLADKPVLDLSIPLDPLYEVPNQTNILDQIAETEVPSETWADLEAQDIKTEQIIIEDEKQSDAFIGFEEDAALMMEAYQEDVANGEYPGAELEVVEYTDPAGNTFELPSIETKAPQEFTDALMNAPEIDASEVDMSKVTWIDAPEVAPQRVKFAVDLEQEDEVVCTEPAAEDHETFEEEYVASIDTINLNENTTIAVVVDETEKEDDDDFGFSFDLNEDNNDNELFL